MDTQTVRQYLKNRSLSFSRLFLPVLFLAGITCFPGHALADDFADAIRLLGNRQYEQAISLLKEGVSQKDHRSEYVLGLIYFNGIGVGKDIQRGISLITQSANRGFARAQNYLGVLYYEGNGVEQNDLEAFQWYW